MLMKKWLSHYYNKSDINIWWLFFFRINVSIFSFIHFLSIQWDFDELYSTSAYVYPDILNASYDQYTFTFIELHQFLNKLNVTVNYNDVLLICRIAYPVGLIMLMLGLFTRFTAIISLFLQLIFIKSIHLYEYGVDYFNTIALFYCCIFPVGNIYSLDNKIFKRPFIIFEHKTFLMLLRIHLGIAYFFSGFDKIIGETWRNGEALWKALHSHNYYTLFSLDSLAYTPFFFISCWFTIIIEMCYPVFMNLKVTRRFWLISIVGLHIFIAIFMGLFFFSGLLIILNLSAYYAPHVRNNKSLR